MENKYKIGEIAKIKNIDSQTLRYYDKLGILTPEIVDDSNGYRYYSKRQFIDVDRIKFYKQIGMSLEEIRIFKNLSSVDDALEVLCSKKDHFLDEINRMQIICSNIDRVVGAITKAKSSDLKDIKIEIRNDIYGVLGGNTPIYNLIDFEIELLNLTKIYPKYSTIGNNFGVILVFKSQILEKNELTMERRTFLRIDEHFSEDENVEKIHLGRCVTSYIKGIDVTNNKLLMNQKQFIKDNNLITKGDMYLIPIVNRFIVENHEDYLYELVIPIEN